MFLKNIINKISSCFKPPEKEVAAFISIPKNGTISVKEILKRNKNSDRNFETIVISEKHQRGKVLKKKYNLDNHFVFCFSRDPYDRSVSWYEYHKDRNLAPYTKLSFENWIQEGMPHHWTELRGTNWTDADLSPLLQYNFVSDCKVDFIGKIEHFERDMSKVIKELNKRLKESGQRLKYRFSNTQKNRSERKSGIEHYFTDETKKIVSEKLHKDFEFIGYKK